jgi:hypothetical protein
VAQEYRRQVLCDDINLNKIFSYIIMSDLDIINSITAEPERPPEHVSLEEIINGVPCMALNNPATYALYLHYNDKHLDDGEKVKVNNIIEKMRRERSAINKKNIQYMEKHLKEKVIEETE